MTSKLRLDKLRDVFSISHDGTITDIGRRGTTVELQISISYLAELIKAGNEHFYIRILECTEFSLKDYDGNVFTSLDEIKEKEPEIYNAETTDGDRVSVHVHYGSGYGGVIRLKAEEVEIFDQDKKQVDFDSYWEICKRYWEKLSNN